ncbi:MAG TPA: copper resistance protein CopC, partial [Chloroflexota bacterium]|nr:copper resistance protein CopC [Chloroflexota bacterium]
MIAELLRRRRSGWRLVGVCVLAMAILGLTTGLASAHANLVRSDPPANASLAQSPAKVQLWFSEPLEPSFSQAVVYDTNQQRVDAGDSHVAPDDSASLIVSLKPNLPKGTYAIAWMTQSKVDGHIVRGIVPFGVGVTSIASTPGPEEGVASGAVSGSPFEMVLRWLTLFASAAMVGSFTFWILQRMARTPLTIAQQRAAAGAWLLFFISNLLLLLNQASIAVGVSLLGAIGGPFMQVAVQTQYGRYWIVRMVLGLTVGGLLITYWRTAKVEAARRIERVAVLVGAALLLSVSLTSHSAAIGPLTPLGITVDWLHLAAMTVWTGGLLQITVIVPSLLRRGPSAEVAQTFGGLIPRFAIIAGISLAILGLTGLIEALIHIGTFDNLLNNGYGEALLVKVLLILPLLSLAAVNHFVILPGFKHGQAASSPTMLGYVRQLGETFRWTVRLELLFVVGVIAAAGVMTSLSPVQQFATAGTGPLTQTGPAGDLSVSFGVNPGRPGPNTYEVEVRDAGGQLTSTVEQASIRFTYLDQNLGVSEVALTSQGNGRFTGQSSDLAVAGRWEAEIDLRRPGRDDVNALFGFEVTPTGAR